jgi:chemotaxis protein MotB
MASDNNIIIVRKKKGGHGGHHGGAWKVAFADFMTAMMAFFLVMWLVGQSKPVKAAIASYFRDPGAFDTKAGGKGILDGGQGPANTPTAAISAAAERQALELSVSHIKEQLDKLSELKTLSNQIEFTITSEGLRIDLLEADKSSFFASGSAGVLPATARILSIIAKEIGTLDNRIIIEGHTDSHKYASAEGYGNWELSADRANAARRVMEREGLKATQVSAVRGHADRELRVPGDPFDPRNRRVSVIVKSQTK